MKTAVAIRHLAFEDLGLIGPWLTRRGWRVITCDAGVDALWNIDLGQVDLLVVLGGPIGAHDDALYPWLTDEVDLIRRRLDSEQPILGICLGAQLMARALGARVAQMSGEEIGYAPLQLTAAGQASPLAALAGQPVLHWHGDQFELPEGLASLGATSRCPHQAFQAGRQAMAWQFHLEVDATRIEQWLIGHTAELQQAGIDFTALRHAAALHREGMAAALDAVMNNWFTRLDL